MPIGKGPVAIYRQIIEYFYYEIGSGRIKSGDRIDSIRNLALQFKVNPNTVQKALNELERESLVVTDRTNGKFVTSDENRIRELRKTLSHEVTRGFVVRMKDLGIEVTDVTSYINEIWEDKE